MEKKYIFVHSFVGNRRNERSMHLSSFFFFTCMFVCLCYHSSIEKCLFEDNWTREERAEYVAVSLQRKWNTSAPFHVIGETHSYIYADLQLLDKMISFAILLFSTFLFFRNKAHLYLCTFGIHLHHSM